jgi:hypothetical protein
VQEQRDASIRDTAVVTSTIGIRYRRERSRAAASCCGRRCDKPARARDSQCLVGTRTLLGSWWALAGRRRCHGPLRASARSGYRAGRFHLPHNGGAISRVQAKPTLAPTDHGASLDSLPGDTRMVSGLRSRPKISRRTRLARDVRSDELRLGPAIVSAANV